MTPLGQRPLDLGADVVVSADTKALNGHSDVLFGHVSSRNSQVISAVRDWRKIAGAVPGPHEAWLVHRGLETLEVRYSRMCVNAHAIAERLVQHPKVVALSLSRPRVASSASPCASANDKRRLSDRAHSCRPGDRRSFHRTLRIHASIDQLWRSSHVRRTARALGRCRARRLHSHLGRLRTDRSAVQGGRARAGCCLNVSGAASDTCRSALRARLCGFASPVPSAPSSAAPGLRARCPARTA